MSDTEWERTRVVWCTKTRLSARRFVSLSCMRGTSEAFSPPSSGQVLVYRDWRWMHKQKRPQSPFLVLNQHISHRCHMRRRAGIASPRSRSPPSLMTGQTNLSSFSARVLTGSSTLQIHYRWRSVRSGSSPESIPTKATFLCFWLERTEMWKRLKPVEAKREFWLVSLRNYRRPMPQAWAHSSLMFARFPCSQWQFRWRRAALPACKSKSGKLILPMAAFASCRLSLLQMHEFRLAPGIIRQSKINNSLHMGLHIVHQLLVRKGQTFWWLCWFRYCFCDTTRLLENVIEKQRSRYGLDHIASIMNWFYV